jgi:hypothetical protein
MMQGTDTQARNQRLAWILVGTFAVLFLGAIFYIDWFHTIGPGASVSRAK